MSAPLEDDDDFEVDVDDYTDEDPVYLSHLYASEMENPL